MNRVGFPIDFRTLSITWHGFCFKKSMGVGKTISREFSGKGRAVAAVRALLNAGIDPRHVEAQELAPREGPPTDVGMGSRRLIITYLLAGVVGGMVTGLLLAFLVFWLPATILQSSNKNLLTAVGILVCVPAGGIVGVMEAFKQVKRHSKPPLSSGSDPSVGVRVRTDDEKELRRARSVLAFSHLSRVEIFKNVRCNNGNDKTQ